MSVVASEIMYIELTGPGQRVGWARIARVTFSKSERTAYFDGRELRSLGRGWYVDGESGEQLWIQHARPDGKDRWGKDRRGSVPVAIDEDVRSEYWSRVRGAADRAHERLIHA